MPIKRLTLVEIIRLINGKFNKEIPTIDPTIDASLAKASSGSTASAGVGLQDGIQDAVDQMFYQTADDEFLELIGEYDNTIRFTPQPSIGQAVGTGVLGTLIPIDTPITARGETYLTTAVTSVQNYSGNISLSYNAGIVSAVTTSIHSLATGLSVIISDAVQPDYNGTFIITVISDTNFTYELVAGSLTTDSGNYNSEYALFNVESINSGSTLNIDAGGKMTIDYPNMDTDIFVGIEGIIGGLDEEPIEDYRTRVGESHNLTPGIATSPSIVFSAKQIAGNTRVLVVRPVYDDTGGTRGVAGYKPDLGEVVVYLLRDNDPSIIPGATILEETKQKIIDDGIWPSFTPEENLFLLAPILLEQNFIFTSITPNTSTMQNAIRDQLVLFFQDNAEINGTITLDQINSFLRQIQDPSNGSFLTDFTYTVPNGNIVADSGEIYTVGTVTFS